MQKYPYYQIVPDTKVADAIEVMPSLLPVIERFELPLGVGDHTFRSLCAKHGVNPGLFVFMGNLYILGKVPKDVKIEKEWLSCLIRYLQKSHFDYAQNMYPHIEEQIKAIQSLNDSREVKMIGRFFNEYMKEVDEHFEYENDTVFPYIMRLLEIEKAGNNGFSVIEYKEHHDDIEEKLLDLKSLLIRHLPVQHDNRARVVLLELLFELEYDLHIHSLIEDTILIPMVEELEKTYGIEQ